MSVSCIGCPSAGALPASDEDPLTATIVRLASQYGRYGYRRITALLRAEGWSVNHQEVERIWRREGLKVFQKQSRRGRLWLADGFCIRLRPNWRHHVWAYETLTHPSQGRTNSAGSAPLTPSHDCSVKVVVRP